MGLTRYGIREWGLATVVVLVLGGLAGAAGWWWAVVVLVLAWIAVAGFFRDPWRRVPTDLEPEAMLAPADGRISAVERVEDHESIGGPAVVVRIYLSVLNVHVNRSPCDLVVLRKAYRPGGYLDVRDPESVTANEALTTVCRRRDDEATLAVRQIAGLVARRIVCRVAAGDPLERGQRYGMIKFGSTTELILPDRPGLEVHVAVGEVVRGGLTHVADLPIG